MIDPTKQDNLPALRLQHHKELSDMNGRPGWPLPAMYRKVNITACNKDDCDYCIDGVQEGLTPRMAERNPEWAEALR